ncbi:MAG: hypothetical protein GTO45_04580 [Candidatus Aminicenantes bacterium]|nr:hypothetical protein [Candidatus Aminicenantes bacterium]NIM78027.1 hypothetical protein [Candidatus Aminicenantes bacterium]NIN17347.1 hypothetical protein [Candidatus Aminicenantes bacterium]NIN41240.1 hypothetical protein [Candidatus Aminicenantes bacterium]NIN84013.1 hypothetical protein [Candidatus Aminicenantes bacterium]
MNIAFEIKRRTFNESVINVYENHWMILGFTEIDFLMEDLAQMFHISPSRLIELKQVHSDTIWFSSQLATGVERVQTEGDGIILDQRGRMAIIKTADCTPLFFWDQHYSSGGVIHIGWQGLLKGIEKKLVKLLDEKSPEFNLQQMVVFLGPSIEAKCYEVGLDLRENFSGKTYRDDIFYIYKSISNDNQTDHTSHQMVMDVKKGIRLSLIESGIPEDHIIVSPLCTFCQSNRFPSHRRHPESDQRIYNFLMLKNE